MNLFVKSLVSYLKNALISDNHAESRFILQSLGPDDVFDLFRSLDSFALELKKTQSVKCYFRVASKLWDEWCKKPNSENVLRQKMELYGAAGPNGELQWIDHEDKLTWYRNRTVNDEGCENLIIILVGMDHATDKGGLSDFHKVDEARIWQELNQSFVPWLETICNEQGIEASSSTLNDFDLVLKTLFELRPRQLMKLAKFIDERLLLLGDRTLFHFDELIDLFFRELHFWGIPPLLSGSSLNSLKGKKGAEKIKAAEKFISHQGFKTASAQKKAWQKIKSNYLDSDKFVLPENVGDAPSFENRVTYEGVLERFIFEANAEAKERLLKTDISKLLDAISTKEVSVPSQKKTVKVYNGMAIEAVLQGVMDSLDEYQRISKAKYFTDDLKEILIEVCEFSHDFTADEDLDLSSHKLAIDTLQSCLGGLDLYFEEMDCRIPLDDQEACRPRDTWSINIPTKFIFDIGTIKTPSSRLKPSVLIRVNLLSSDETILSSNTFRWSLSSTHPERVLAGCSRSILDQWNKNQRSYRLLPAFKVSSDAMMAMYYAADEDEANRLLSQAMTSMEVINLIDDLPQDLLDMELNIGVDDFLKSYLKCLKNYTELGLYACAHNDLRAMLTQYVALTEKTMSSGLKGSHELLRRWYKAFFIIDEKSHPNDNHLNSAIAWGLSPALLELIQAKCRFLTDGFPEVLADMVRFGRLCGQKTFDRLIELSKIQRPIPALKNQQNQLCAELKSYGLLHFLGGEPRSEMSLSVQTMLRENENDDDEDISDIIRPCQERDLVSDVITDYQRLYSYAQDGLRIMAINVKDLQVVLSGIDYFLDNYLKESNSNSVSFSCSVMVYTSASSPMVMEKRLILWRDHLIEKHRESGGRELRLEVGHQFAAQEQLPELLSREVRLYDIAFLFHFLKDGLNGHATTTKPFEYHFDNCAFFPIAEHPRPIKRGDNSVRYSLISNRRLQAQTRHGNMSAQMSFNGYKNSDVVIFGKVEFTPWKKVVDVLHTKAHWVACIDPFIDKQLMIKDIKDDDIHRKIVGFTSGLGAYGELNLTVSTQQDTLKELSDKVKNRLINLFPFAEQNDFETLAVRVVDEAEQVVGMSSLKAVVGEGQQIREIIGFAAIQRALGAAVGDISQLLPLDSMRHWFSDNETGMRPDLLQLKFHIRENDIPLIEANLIECKLAQKNTQHTEKACEQLSAGLKHLSTLFAPIGHKFETNEFDRRYWWAQLHRALSSRAEVNLSEQQWVKLEAALEDLTEGRFEIHWRSTMFTFWTDLNSQDVEVTERLWPSQTVPSPFKMDEGSCIQQIQVGYPRVLRMFSEITPEPLFIAPEPKISLRAEQWNSFPSSNEYGVVNPSSESSLAHGATPVDLGTGVKESSVDSDNELAPASEDIGDVPEMEEIGTQTSSNQRKDESLTVLPSLQKSEPKGDTTQKKAASSAIESETHVELGTMTFNVPEKVLLGKRKNGTPVFWHFGHAQLPNRHLLIFGSSGSGKTYGIQCFLSELAKQQVRSLIIDYTNGFLPSQVAPLFNILAQPKTLVVKTEKLPLNPFRRQSQVIDPAFPPIEESVFDVASRIVSIFTSVFSTMGDQQSAALQRVLQNGLNLNPNFTLNDLLEPLRSENSQGESLANKLQPFIDASPFSNSKDQAWEQMLNAQENRVNILQLAGFARDLQKMITEFALWDLWDYASSSGNEKRPIPVVLDEIQNLDHSSDSPIDKMLREGRKFGLSLILATQTTSQFNNEQRDRLFQAGHKLFFKPASTEVDRFAQILAQSTQESKDEWKQRLSKLEKGWCWSLGPIEKSDGSLIEEAVLVNITSLDERAEG